ncbi:MAG: YIP1 family protein [Rhodobacteraceae bacterium]|nr:YIP1 family protein [Paracoccaceae bacterium]MCF8515364.1 YIP1 family protein [Paracoccaceae bacterium]MCF8519451.1 YIP1 family protein [Paracoccaceae bacterium]
MAVTSDIIESWWQPRAVLRRHLGRGQSEAFAFSLLFVFLLMAFVAQWPVAAREAFAAGEPSALPRMLALGFAVLATIPIWYGLAAASRLLARAMGGKGAWYGARMALFAALVAISPLMLLQGLVAAMVGPGAGLVAIRVAVGLGFLYIWTSMLIEAER